MDTARKPADVTVEALFRAVIETSDDAIFSCDPAGRITSWSLTAERLFGRQAVAVLGETLQTLFPPHLAEEVRTIVATVVAGERITHHDSELQRSDGMLMPGSLSLCPILDADEHPAVVLVIIRDVTEQRLAQATLSELEGRLQEGEVLDHLGSWSWDLRTGAVQWSTEFHWIHGVGPLDFDGTFDSHLALIHAQDRVRVRAAMESSVCSGRTFEDSYRVVRPDGGERVVRVRAQPMIGSAGTPVGLRGIGQDVTEESGALSSA